MNVSDRVTRIRCVPVKRCSASSRAREKEEPPPGAARRVASRRVASRRRGSTPRVRNRVRSPNHVPVARVTPFDVA